MALVERSKNRRRHQYNKEGWKERCGEKVEEKRCMQTGDKADVLKDQAVSMREIIQQARSANDEPLLADGRPNPFM